MLELAKLPSCDEVAVGAPPSPTSMASPGTPAVDVPIPAPAASSPHAPPQASIADVGADDDASPVVQNQGDGRPSQIVQGDDAELPLPFLAGSVAAHGSVVDDEGAESDDGDNADGTSRESFLHTNAVPIAPKSFIFTIVFRADTGEEWKLALLKERRISETR